MTVPSCSLGCREAMQQEKRMLEQQLLETSGDMARAKRRLTGSHVSSLASNRSSSMEYSSDEEGGHHISHLADISAREVEALRTENEAIMKVRLTHHSSAAYVIGLSPSGKLSMALPSTPQHLGLVSLGKEFPGALHHCAGSTYAIAPKWPQRILWRHAELCWVTSAGAG